MASFVKDAFSGRNPFIIRISLIAALGGLLFGYDTGVISGALLFIKKDLHAGKQAQSWIVASLLLGAVIGAIVAGYLADRISRRWTKFISGIVYVGGALWAAFSPNVTSLIIARFVLGLSVGTASFVSPMYIAEQTPPKLRGGFVSFNQLMITSGILIAYIIDFALGSNWRLMLALGAVPGLALAIGMLTVPHTPRWLAEKGRDEEAHEVLEKTREEGDVDEEMDEIKKVSSEEAKSVRDLLRPTVRPMLYVGIALAVFQQIVGINTVIYYAPTILQYTGKGASGAIGQTVFVGVTNVVFTIVAILLLDKIGRRTFLITGTVGLTIALAVLGVFFHIHSVQQHAPWLALAALLLYIASFAVGLGPVFWLMIAEIYPLKIRGKAMSVATVFNWGFNFIVSYTFLQLVGTMGRAGVFWLYAGIGVIAVLYFASKVPETKGRTLEEIEEDVAGGQTRAHSETGAEASA